MNKKVNLLKQSNITFVSSTKKAVLKQNVISLKQASYSTVLSLANFLLIRYPTLAPPNLRGNLPTIKQTDILINETYLTYNILYEPWCDYLALLMMTGKIVQKDDVCYFYDEVAEDFIEKLQQTKGIFEFSSRNSPKSIIFQEKEVQKLYKNTLTNKKETKQKIVVMNFATSQLRTDIYQPKIHLLGLFTGIFYNQGDQWSVYNVLKAEFPTQQQYNSIDTIIMSGSSLSVNNEVGEVEQFVQSLKKGLKTNPRIKILGICFGHQLLAKMFGGQIIQKNLLTGIQRINFDEKLMQTVPYFQRSNLQYNIFQLSQYHKDFVTSVPQNFNILAESQTCLIESLISKDMRYLSFQFHPEYSAEYIRGFEMRLEHYQIYDMKSAYSHHEIGSIRHESSLWEIRKVIRNFLNWETEVDIKYQIEVDIQYDQGSEFNQLNQFKCM